MSQSGRVAVGHPVDVASGVLFNVFTDFAVPGLLPLTFQRFYSTGLLGRQSEEPLGPGWRHAFQHELRQTLDGFAYVDAMGAELALEDTANAFEHTGKLVLPGSQMELRGDRDALTLQFYGSDTPQWLWRFRRKPQDTRYVLESIELNARVKLALDYDGRGRLSRILQTRSGRALRLSYDSTGRLASVTFDGNPAELVARFVYDKRGFLVRVVDRVGEAASFEYDDAGRMLSEARCSGAVYVFRYDAQGRCVYAAGANRHEERTLQYDAARRKTLVADSHGHITAYEYNEAGQVTSILTPLGGKASFVYDDLGRLVTSVSANQRQSTVEYDAQGQVISSSLPDGRKHLVAYDEGHRPVRVSDTHGEQWTFDFDAEGRRVRTVDPRGREWRYRYTPFGELESVRSPQGHEDRCGYDSRGHLATYVNPDGRVWRTDYDVYGRPVAQVDPSGGVTRRVYDKAGKLSRVEAPDGRRWQYTYDSGGRCTSNRGPDGTLKQMQYNACGQLVEVVQPDGTVLRLEWDTEPGRILAIEDARGRRLAWTYDEQGRPSSRSNWDGSVARFEFDLAANLTAVTDPTGARYTFEYDAWHNLVTRTTPDGVTTRYEYDALSLPVKVSRPGSELIFARDTLGRVLAETHNGVTVRSAYDDEGRRVELGSDLAPPTRFEWTPGSLCSAIHEAEGTLRFEYGPNGEEVRRELPGGGVFEQVYDKLGRLLEQCYVQPGGKSALGQRGAEGSLRPPALIRRAYGYDELGHVSFIEDSLRGHANFIHNAVGRLQAVVRSGGETEFFEYDETGNRKVAAWLPDSGARDLKDVLQRDARGWLRLDVDALRERGAEVTTARTAQGNQTTEVLRDGNPWRYTYDRLGRLVRKEVAREPHTEVWTYEWNRMGQLAAVTRPDGECWRYEYDVLGRRVAKHGPAGARRYVWSGQQLLHEVAPSGEVATYIHHPRHATPVMERRGNTVAYVLTDGVGSACERVAADGQVLWAAGRGTWGEVAPETPDGEPGFPGQTYDAESGLYYNFARYYDPGLGRYISPDPIGLLGGLNEYSYVPSPVCWSDVLGLTYYNGGPYPWAPQGDPIDATNPDLMNPANRYVRGEDGRPYVAKAPSDSTNGKCLTIVTGVPSNHPALESRGFREGEIPAFVSGHGHPHPTPDPVDFDVNRGQMGNWCHGEIQALNFLHTNGISGATVYVDRPPCSQCDNKLQGILNAHFNQQGKPNVTVLYPNADRTGYITWEEHKAEKAKAGSTGSKDGSC
ncbi:hypothetical protein D7Y27_37720 [Corallococcus sp. AB004]|uniref:RHS repeat-associated core domain-containing protein n=1 Tax=Corallococcus exiguus TaxID=83462 RepID=UPI000EA185F6|nr:RHS repeat-associated core domain-containing protein [Corallococcus exiguus]NPC75380.1 hypothetical protein [Corallococcus exiguus]NPD29078.1 hypothetical protein [Corallococcus exiguus]RKI31457.1 hypothetical protein D7Y27_37720 [Corallococcus sp. AB004]